METPFDATGPFGDLDAAPEHLGAPDDWLGETGSRGSPFANADPVIDPLWSMLDHVESSTVQPMPPGMDEPVDPLSTHLDQIERHIENQHARGQGQFAPMPDAVDHVLEELEASIEQQEMPPQPPGCEEDLDQSTRVRSVSGPMSRPPVPDTGELSRPREYPYPTKRMGGTGSGLRYSGGTSCYYCHLHERWVAPEECGSCADFEESESPMFVEECCRHSSQSADNV
jgi:hypothetical protein